MGSDTFGQGERPAWVRHALAGEGGPVYDHAARPFVGEELMAEAVLRAGVDDWGGDSFVEPLSVLVDSVEHESTLHVVGRWRARETVVRYLENRLRLVEACRRDPAIDHEVIDAPLVVSGSPRAGTSIMHQLLALAPGARAPLAYEYWAPVSPGVAPDPRIPIANADVRLSAALNPGFDGIHEQGALLPREDGSALGMDLRGDLPPTHYGLPSYAAWLASCDMTSGYRWHRRVLQVLQHQRPEPTGRWVLKWPTHVSFLPVLFATYPDARVVICHRDPVAMLSSVTSLVATLRFAHCDRVDLAALAADQIDTFGRQCDTMLAADRAGLLPEGRVAHVRFADFIAAEVAAVGRALDGVGLDLGAEHQAAIRQHLADRPRGRLGGHVHQADDLGVNLDALDERFAEYREHFDIEAETR
jgi:hypothetical protein